MRRLLQGVCDWLQRDSRLTNYCGKGFGEKDFEVVKNGKGNGTAGLKMLSQFLVYKIAL